MPRIKMLRKVLNPPIIKGFKPYGPESSKFSTTSINMLFEEYEALRLCDYDNCNHHQASVMMGVSRPTFTRIYASALHKIAIAFVEGKQISIDGGKVYFDSDWYHCAGCHCAFNNPEKDKEIQGCPLCGSMKICRLDSEHSIPDDSSRHLDDKCVCPSCGLELEHQHGQPCNQQICPKCNISMIRQGTPFCRNSNKS